VADQQDQTQKREFDVGTFLAEKMGGAIKDVTPDGKVKFATRDADGVEKIQQFDVQSFLRGKGQDPEKLQLKYNNPETALEGNAIPFGAGVKLAVARKDEDKQKILEEEFGAGNVAKTTSGFTVKQNGVWKTADTSFMQNITADSPIMAAGIGGTIAGSKAGALAGTAVAPGIGTAIGGFLGGVLGGAGAATAARLGQIELAEKFGIRSEADAQELQAELGKEFAQAVVWDASLFGAGKLVKGVAGASKGIVRRIGTATMDREGISATMEKLLPGTQAVDWRTILDSPENGKAVLQEMDDVIKWSQSPRATKDAIDPVSNKIVNTVQNSMKRFKTQASQNYETAMTHLEDRGIFNKVRVDMEGVHSSLKTTLSDLGLLDESGNFLTKSTAKDSDQIQQIFDAKSRRTLKEVYESISKPFQKSSEGFERGQVSVSYQEAKKMLNGIDDILESSGFYKGGEMAISNNARKALKEVRFNVRNGIRTGLDDKMVDDLAGMGTKVKASEIYDKASSNWHNFRNSYDDFAIASRFDGDEKNVVDTVNRMLGENGYNLEASFGRMAEAAGGNSREIINRLQVLRSAKNLSPIYAPGQSGKGVVLSTAAFGGPRETAEKAAAYSQSIANREAAKNTPVSKATLTGLQSLGKGINWVKNELAPHDRQLLLNNPEMYRGFINAITAVPGQTEEMTNQLTNGN
jgi:hypothetical protein